MAEEKIVRTIDIKTSGAEKSLGSIDKATKNVSESTGKLDKNMQALPGPLGKAQAGVKTLGTAFKALLANPIVLLIAAIVLALASLFKAFTKTKEGADKMKDAMAGIRAVVDALVDRMAKLFKALVQIFKGNFKQGFDEMKGAVSGLREELTAAAKDAIAYERAMRALFRAETDIIVSNAELRRQQGELLFLTRDLTLSVEKRKEAIIAADAIEREILNNNIKLQAEKLRLAEQDLKNTPELQRSDEQLRMVANERVKLIQLETQSLRVQKKLKAELNTLDLEAEGERKAAQSAKDEIAKAEADRLAEEKKIKNEERRAEMELELDLEAEFQASMAEMEKKAADDKKALDEETQAALISQAEKRFRKEEELIAQQIENEHLLASVKEGIYENSVTALLGFLGEGSRIAKGIQVADATRTAIQSAISAYKSAVGIPIVGAVLGPIAAAAALAAGMANVRKIIQTPDPTGAPSPAVPSVSLAQPSASINPDDLVNANQGIPTDVSIIQDSTTRGAVKTYVVQSDVTAAQDIEKQREAEVTL